MRGGRAGFGSGFIDGRFERVVDRARPENLQAEQRKYELGAETIFFVLDAQTQLSGAEQSLVQAQINYERAVAQVDRVTGRLLTKNHIQITQ